MNKKVNLYRYSVPLQSQLILRGSDLPRREGLLVRIQCRDREGWGEIAPLPGFSHENIETAAKQTALWLEAWNQNRAQNRQLPFAGLSPSVAFGLSCALAEMQNQLQREGNYQTVSLYTNDANEFNSSESGKTVKLKVASNPHEAMREGQYINEILQTNSHLSVRLDANRRWNLTQALIFAEQITSAARARIQFIEEPCLTASQSRQFALQTALPIAWDETVREANFQPVAEPFLVAIVLKPTLIGSLSDCIYLIKRAQQCGLQVVISSAIESSFGLTQLARIAAQYTAATAPGLDTLNLMAFQLVRMWPNSALPVVGLDDSSVITKLI